MAVDENGYFTDRITDFRGKYVKEADNDITQAVKARDSNTPLFLWHYNVRAFNFYEHGGGDTFSLSKKKEKEKRL